MSVDIDGKTKLYGLIGNPIAHSFSPLIHNYLAKKFSVNSVYVPLRLEHPPDDLNQIFYAMKLFDVAGINVTAPYKNFVADYLQNLSMHNNISVAFGDETSKLVGSVNTVKRIGEKFLLFNTDVYGLEKTFRRHNISPNNQNVIVFGAGGAAKTVIYLLARLNAKKIFIANRNLSHAHSIASSLSPIFPSTSFAVVNLFDDNVISPHEYFYLAVQATCLGSGDFINISPVIDNNFFSNLSCALDLAYNPVCTEFLSLAEKNGALIINGFEMLFFQALRSFEIWNDFIINNDSAYELFDYLYGVVHHEKK